MIKVTPKAVEKIREAFEKRRCQAVDCVWACWAAAARA